MGQDPQVPVTRRLARWDTDNPRVWIADEAVDSSHAHAKSRHTQLHHLLHSPAALAAYAIICWAIKQQLGLFDPRVVWFLSGAASHALIDLFSHGRDGILLFWPWERTYRFDDGINQWDMNATGSAILAAEILLFLAFGLWIIWSRRCLPPSLSREES